MKLLRNSPYFLAIAVLALLVWAGWVLFNHPDPGLTWVYGSGAIESVDPAGPAAGQVTVGQQIVAIDGQPVNEARGLPGHMAGERVIFLVQGSAGLFPVAIELQGPTPAQLFRRLAPLLVALSFWLPGVLVLAFSQQQRLPGLFFLFTQVLCACLGLGSISGFVRPLWVGWVFTLLVWWIGPLVVHLHLELAPSPSTRFWRRHVLALYVVPLLGTLVDLSRLWLPLPAAIQPFKYLWLAANLLAAIALLAYIGRRAPRLDVRRRVGILALATLLAFLPSVLFALLPEALLGQTILPYELAFISLPALPLGYGYAIQRYNLINLERYINRSAAYALAGIIVAAIYALIYSLAARHLPGQGQPLNLLGLALTTALIFGVQPIYLQTQRIINQIFYGGWYDDRAAFKQISQALSQTEGDVSSVGDTLCQALERTMQLEYVNLLLADGQILSSTESGAGDRLPAGSAAQALAALQGQAHRELGSCQRLAEMIDLPVTANRRLLGRKPQLWLLLTAGPSPLGLLILGERRGGGEFETHDLEILEVVVRQARSALQNAALLEELRQHSDKIRRLHRQVLQAREAERKRLARELHDQVIQSLVGLNYRLAEVRHQPAEAAHAELPKIQGEVRRLLGDVRQVCADLRPPALDTLGLVPALQARITELETQVPFEINFHLQDNFEGDLPEDVSLCLYRVFQEGIQNARKHSAARTLNASLEINLDRIVMQIADDGQGFTLPPNFSAFLQRRHFGLFGLQELLETVQGTLEIHTAPGKGCTLVATIPQWAPVRETPASRRLQAFELELVENLEAQG